MNTEKRLGFAGIIVEDRDTGAAKVNEILHEYADIIVARVGIPYMKKNCCVITLVVDASNDEIGSLSGKLGSIPGVSVKTGLAKEK